MVPPALTFLLFRCCALGLRSRPLLLAMEGPNRSGLSLDLLSLYKKEADRYEKKAKTPLSAARKKKRTPRSRQEARAAHAEGVSSSSSTAAAVLEAPEATSDLAVFRDRAYAEEVRRFEKKVTASKAMHTRGGRGAGAGAQPTPAPASSHSKSQRQPISTPRDGFAQPLRRRHSKANAAVVRDHRMAPPPVPKHPKSPAPRAQQHIAQQNSELRPKQHELAQQRPRKNALQRSRSMPRAPLNAQDSKSSSRIKKKFSHSHRAPLPPPSPMARSAPTRSLAQHLQTMGLSHYLALLHWAGASEAQHLALLDAEELAALGIKPADAGIILRNQSRIDLPVDVDLPARQIPAERGGKDKNLRNTLPGALQSADFLNIAPPDGRPPTVAALAKAVPGLSSKPWACHVCTFLNEVPGTVFCGMCEARKHVEPGTVKTPALIRKPRPTASPVPGPHIQQQLSTSGLKLLQKKPSSSSLDKTPDSNSSSQTVTPRANLSAAAAAAAELSQRRRESSELSPYINDQRLASHSRTSMTRHNTARELKFAAKCLLLDLAASASDTETESGASDLDSPSRHRNTSSRPRLRQTAVRQRANALLDRLASGSESDASNNQTPRSNRRGSRLHRSAKKRALVNYVMNAIGPDRLNKSRGDAGSDNELGSSSRAQSAGPASVTTSESPSLSASIPRGFQDDGEDSAVPEVWNSHVLNASLRDSEVAVGEVSSSDRIVAPNDANSRMVKIHEGFLTKRASTFPWAYRRRWFTLAAPRGGGGTPILFYSTDLMVDGASAQIQKKNSGSSSDSTTPLEGSSGSSSIVGSPPTTGKHSRSNSIGGDSARGERLLTRDCFLQLNHTDVEQLTVGMPSDQRALLVPRQLQYLEFAILRTNSRRGGTEELLRARAKSSALLALWVRCLCYAILSCNEDSMDPLVV